MIQRSEAFFVTTLHNQSKRVTGAIMLPNTTHMDRDFNKRKYKEMVLQHLARHHLSYIDTSFLVVNQNDREVYIQPKRDQSKKKNIQRFSFNNAYHRFGASDLSDSELSNAQREYLSSKVIAHSWAAIHNGIVVGMVFYPHFTDQIPNDPRFVKYLSDTNVLLKKIGYFVSGDLVLTKDGELKFFRVLKNRTVGRLVYKNWTQELILTKNLKTLIDFEEE